MATPDDDITRTVELLAVQMRKRLGLRSRDAFEVLRKGRHRLPPSQQDDLDYLIEVHPMAAHPRLARQIDVPRTERLLRQATEHLKSVDLVRERRFRRFAMASAIMVQLAVVVALVVAVIFWRDLL